MIKLHDTTINLMVKMYNPEEFQKVMEHILYFIMTEENRGHVFMVLKFGDSYVDDKDISTPTEKYIWN